MPVFDFGTRTEKDPESRCTYTIETGFHETATPKTPLLVLSGGPWPHHSSGIFQDPGVRTSFCFDPDPSGSAAPEGKKSLRVADILKIDSRFTNLVAWLGKNRIHVRLSGENTDGGYAVYKIRETLFSGAQKLSGQDGFLQFMITRLLSSKPVPEPELSEEDEEPEGDEMKLTSLQSITDFLSCAGRTLPENIRIWARRNLAVARSAEVSPEERRHAQHALSVMLNVQWRSSYFPPIDVKKARQILDEALYGMEKVKQRILETVIQINRTHTLPAYGLLLAGPAGTGKSQVAYAVARILGLPWTTLDLSSIHDPEQLTGSSRVYTNAKPGIIMEAFSMAGESNLVFIINELDKAGDGNGKGNPADVLLTLLDNLGFTDNYMECMIPTLGVYPVATANDKSRISAPLLSRFALIDIPDYTKEEKAVIFSNFSLPKTLRRLGLKNTECVVTEDGVQAVVSRYGSCSGIRDLEQAAEHIAANALYRIETTGVKAVVYDRKGVNDLLC